MSAYFQMGHDTENLISETDLDEFSGIILSPVNRDPYQLNRHTKSFKEIGKFDIILDPQLYYPRGNRKHLANQPYFPSDFDTADISTTKWWSTINSSLAKFACDINVDAVTSPTVIPRKWDDTYYSICVDTCRNLYQELSGENIRVLSTVMFEANQFGDISSILRLASIFSEAQADGYYLVIVSDIEPRRELFNYDNILSVMNLIKELARVGKPIIVSFCSSDMLLFKAAGASHCATGKFFNLRRFTKSRWDEPTDSGGGQLPYWFEHSLLAFLRGADLKRLEKKKFSDLIGVRHSDNYWSKKIIDQFEKEPGKSWLGLSWRQYLSWFGKTEKDLSNKRSQLLVTEWLKVAETNWLFLDDNNVLFNEPRNNGSWLRPWRQTLGDFLVQ